MQQKKESQIKSKIVKNCKIQSVKLHRKEITTRENDQINFFDKINNNGL